MHLPAARQIAAAEARALIETRFPPRWRADILDDLNGLTAGRVLHLPAGTVTEGDLKLDWDAVPPGIVGLYADGPLTVTGDILNDDAYGGPFLVVAGELRLHHMIKRGAPLVALGPVRALGTLLCEHHHGSFRALGGLAAAGLVIDDQRHDLAGPVDAVVFVMWRDAPGAFLRPEFVDDQWPIDDATRALIGAIRLGQPVFRADAPRRRQTATVD